MTTSTTTPGTVGELVDLDDLIWSCCYGGAVELQMAGYGGHARFVHWDGSVLCSAHAGRVIEPIEVAR